MKRANKFIISKPSHLFLLIFLGTLLLLVILSLQLVFKSNALAKNLEQKTSFKKMTYFAPISPTPTVFLKPKAQVKSAQDSIPWGIAKQINETTWTMRVEDDALMATSQEVFTAINNYRIQKGSKPLSWDQNLADFAEKRAQTFESIRKLDGHSGFQDYLKNEENVKALGFFGLGENSSFGFRLSGVHLIEWIFAGDEPHDKNQLDSSWTNVGIGISGTGVDIIFGKDKI